MTNFTMGRNTNATLIYGSNVANVRVSKTSYTYGVKSTESHARLDRAFYPKRRALGMFTITVDAIGYVQYRQFMNWLREYANTLFINQIGNQKSVATIDVQVPSRKFHMAGILTKGIDDHDHVGSNVFSPTLSFLLVKDYNDIDTKPATLGSVSTFIAPKVQDVLTGATQNGPGGKSVVTTHDQSGTASFYPASSNSYKDMQASLYDLPDPVIANLPNTPVVTDPGGNFTTS